MRVLDDLLDQPIANRYFSLSEGEQGLRFPLHHFLMFHGPRGVGKATAARLFIKRFFCEKRSGCDQCFACHLVNSNNHPDYVAFPEGNIMIGDEKNPDAYTIRWLKKNNLRYHSYYSGMRFVFFPNGMALQHEAEVALLKILEEPPPNTYFVMVIHQRRSMKDTILSRAFEIPFFALREETLRKMSGLQNPQDIELLGGNLFWMKLMQSPFPDAAREKIKLAWHHLQDMLELENWLAQELDGPTKKQSTFAKQASEYTATDLLDFFTLLLLQSCKMEFQTQTSAPSKKLQHILKIVFTSREQLRKLGRTDSAVLIPYIMGQLFARLRALWLGLGSGSGVDAKR